MVRDDKRKLGARKRERGGKKEKKEGDCATSTTPLSIVQRPRYPRRRGLSPTPLVYSSVAQQSPPTSKASRSLSLFSFPRLVEKSKKTLTGLLWILLPIIDVDISVFQFESVINLTWFHLITNKLGIDIVARLIFNSQKGEGEENQVSCCLGDFKLFLGTVLTHAWLLLLPRYWLSNNTGRERDNQQKKKTTRALLLLSSRRQSPDPARQQQNAVGCFCFSYIRGVYCVCNDGTSFFLCPLTFFFFLTLV